MVRLADWWPRGSTSIRSAPVTWLAITTGEHRTTSCNQTGYNDYLRSNNQIDMQRW
jgi:hypothetical protein